MNCNLWAGLWRFFLVEWPSFVGVQGALVASLFTTWALNSQGKPIFRISENVVYICGQLDFQNQSDLLYQVTSIPGKPQVSDKRVGWEVILRWRGQKDNAHGYPSMLKEISDLERTKYSQPQHNLIWKLFIDSSYCLFVTEKEAPLITVLGWECCCLKELEF